MASRERDVGRKYESGSSKRKKIGKRKELEQQLCGSLCQYFKTENPVKEGEKLCDKLVREPLDKSQYSSAVGERPSSRVEESQLMMQSPGTSRSLSSALSLPSLLSPAKESVCETPNQNMENDPALWLQQTSDVERERIQIVRKGPIRTKVDFFPINESGRRFSEFHYTRILANGEKQERRWLIYSRSKDAVYCFACRLFCFGGAGFSSHEGISDWKHLGDYVRSHENSQPHKQCILKWLDLEKRLKLGTTIDSISQTQIEEEKQRWRNILERLLAIVQFLASHNLSFRGHKEKLESDYGGNFLDLVKLIAQFDPTLQDHLRQALNKTVKDHYLGKHIQNELIQLIASHIKSKIVEKVSKSKYFSIILDCTRDVARIEQLSVILRFTNKDTAEIEEHFVSFIAVEKTTAESLTSYIFAELERLGLSLENCRGQGYDNDANMRGEKSGVQTRILDVNPLAFFVPCGSHSWNLVLGDAASCCVRAKSFFGILQRLYTLFSGSCERWAILKDHVHISLKPLSETRWECRVESVKAVRYQLNSVCDALQSLAEKSTDCTLVSECQSLESQITTYEFIASLAIWYEILTKINVISKVWQSEKMILDVAVNHLEQFIKWLADYRVSGFQSTLVTAREIAEEVGIERTFKTTRRRRKKRQFEYEAEDQDPELSAEERFKIDYFYVIVDTIWMSCEPRFDALKKHKNTFGFMYKVKNLIDMSDDELMRHCKNLENVLKVGEKKDIDGMELYEELKMFSRVFDGENNLLSALKYISENNLAEIYPNVDITLRIIATIPVTVASAERSFSRLKLIKTYLRSTMSQDRLSDLALISIEKDVASSLDYSALLEDFSQRKSRRAVL